MLKKRFSIRYKNILFALNHIHTTALSVIISHRTHINCFISIFGDMARHATKRLSRLRKSLFAFSDFFYPVVSSFFPKQMYRYAFFGMMNVVLDNVLFMLFFYVLLAPYAESGLIDFGIITIKRHVLALALSAPIVVVFGFLLMRYIVFDRSRKEKAFFQFLKYIASSISGVFLNYVFIRIFVEAIHWSADISKILTSIIVVLYSYFFQTKITFRKKAI